MSFHGGCFSWLAARAVASVGTADEDGQKHDRNDQGATKVGKNQWSVFEVVHTAILQEFVTFRYEVALMAMSISSQDLIVFFCSFGVALVALNLYKLTQPAND